MAEPSQPALSEQCEHGRKSSTFKALGICHLVTSMDAEDAAKAAHVEGVQFASDSFSLLFWNSSSLSCLFLSLSLISLS